MERKTTTIDELLRELDETRRQLEESNDTIEAIRTGQVDALVVQNRAGHQLYSLTTADHAYRVFIEKMTEGAVTLNQQGIIEYANSQFAEMVGLPLSQIIGIAFQQFITKDKQPFYETLFQSCWKDDCKGEIELYNNGQFTPVQLSLTALELPDGISLSVILTDLSRQKNAQKLLEENNHQLEQLNRTLEQSNYDLQQFASVASHDLQEPLRKIQMFGTIMKNKWQGKLGDEDMLYLNKMIGSAARMKTLINDVLNYSGLSANDAEYSPTNLNIIVKELLEDFELLIKDKGATISYAKLPVLEVNPGQIRQVFQNLISNALKFSKLETAPVIKISAKCLDQLDFDAKENSDGPYCMIAISDNGIGFDEKYSPVIFTLFERLHAKHKYEGTGIGLAITKKIVEKHAGIISVTSVIGQGSEFRIILPKKQNR